MSPRSQANAAAYQALIHALGPIDAERLLRDMGEGVVRSAFDFADRQIAWKRTHPCAAAAFHREMAKLAPRGWRWTHRVRARRWTARCLAMGHRCPGMEGT